MQPLKVEMIEPHRHIVHIRNTRIGFIVNARLCENLCFYVPMWFKMKTNQKSLDNIITDRALQAINR